MAKVNVSVTRQLTINTGNYESIKPTVTPSVTDLNPDDVGDAYLAMEEAISGLIRFEILACASDGKKVSEGLDRFCKNVVDNQAEIGENIEKSLNKLNSF